MAEKEGEQAAPPGLTGQTGSEDLLRLLKQVAQISPSPSPLPLPKLGESVGRFELRRIVGRGGFGVVFEAFDTELKRLVAVKVRGGDGPAADEETSGGRELLGRFRREAEAAARLNHPNIVTCHDFGVHDGLPYLVLELLDGETLQERLERGPLDVEAAVAIVADVARGLLCAHRAGVLHRDLKPSNVFITTGGQVKVLDFGLARMFDDSDPPTSFAAPAGGEHRVTRESTWRGAGTPGYMAPEQWRGEAGDERTDVFSAAVILYRLIAGRLPFQASSKEGERSAFDFTPPPPLRLAVPAVSPELDAVVAHALAPAPENRFASAKDLLEALLAVEEPRGIAKKRGLLAAVTLAMLVVGLGSWLLVQRAARRAAHAPRRSVAVLGFKNLSGSDEDAWLQTALSELLSSALAAGGQLRVVTNENVARARLELGLTEESLAAPTTLQRVRSGLGADYVVLGDYGPSAEAADAITLHLVLEDARKQKSLAVSTTTGSGAKLAELAEKAAARLRSELGMSRLTQSEQAEIVTSLPADPRAARLYAEGLAKEHSLDPASARPRLEQAVALEPGFAPSHAALARALLETEDPAGAAKESKRALDLAGTLPKEDRLALQAAYYRVARDRARTVETFRALVQLAPDNLEHGLNLADALDASGRSEDAYATLGALRKLPPPAGDDPRIDLFMAQVAGHVSDYRRSREAAARAADVGLRRGQRFVVAQARLKEGYALNHLGQPEAALKAYEEARRVYAELGNRSGLARALGNIGNMQISRGELGRARSNLEEAVAIHHQQGAKVFESNALNALTVLLEDLGNVKGARQAADECIALRSAVHLKPAVLSARMYRARLACDSGDLERAARECQELEPMLREGNLSFEHAVCKRILGSVAYQRGDMTRARSQITEAIRISLDRSHKYLAAACQMSLAEVPLDEGHAGEAEAYARAAIAGFQKAKSPDEEMMAHSLLARVLLASGKSDDARKEIAVANARAERSEHVRARLMVAAAAAQLDGASARPGDVERALHSLAATSGQAQRAGLVPQALEARLAAGEIERAAHRPGARAHLVALAQDARRLGFLRIAKRAARR